jgi:hypothetical protein
VYSGALLFVNGGLFHVQAIAGEVIIPCADGFDLRSGARINAGKQKVWPLPFELVNGSVAGKKQPSPI